MKFFLCLYVRPADERNTSWYCFCLKWDRYSETAIHVVMNLLLSDRGCAYNSHTTALISFSLSPRTFISNSQTPDVLCPCRPPSLLATMFSPPTSCPASFFSLRSSLVFFQFYLYLRFITTTIIINKRQQHRYRHKGGCLYLNVHTVHAWLPLPSFRSLI